MGTNYYRIPSEKELREIKFKNNKSKFFGGEPVVPQKVHLGKMSMGWPFTWNFNKTKWYSDRQSIEDFVRRGKIIDEYEREISTEDFLMIAFEYNKNVKLNKNRLKEWGLVDRDGLMVSTSAHFL